MELAVQLSALGSNKFAALDMGDSIVFSFFRPGLLPVPWVSNGILVLSGRLSRENL